MEKCALSDLKAGMIVAEDIYIYDSDLLMEKGEKISDSLIKTLLRFNIKTVAIQTEPLEEEREDGGEIDYYKICREELLEKFRVIPSEPFMKVIFETALESGIR